MQFPTARDDATMMLDRVEQVIDSATVTERLTAVQSTSNDKNGGAHNQHKCGSYAYYSHAGYTAGRNLIRTILYTRSRQQRRSRTGSVYLFVVHLFLTMLVLIRADNRWCGLELSEQISRADVVAKASVVSRSAVERGKYLATFRIDKLLHSTSSKFNSKFLRLRIDSPNFHLKSTCPIAAKVKPHTKYLLMVKQTGEHQVGLFAGKDEFALVSPPLRATKGILRDTRSILCPNCSSRRSHSKEVKKRHSRHQREDTNVRKTRREQMRLTCSARGNPPPTLYWTMNGHILHNSHAAKIVTKKISKYLRKSILKLQGPVNASIHVQCHAYNSYGHTSRVKLKTVTVATTTTTTTPRPVRPTLPLMRQRKQLQHSRPGRPGSAQHSQHSQLRRTKSISAFSGVNNPMYSTGCPLENYCMNGGTCRYYSDIGELTCHCSRGFHGRRCERKYVSGAKLHGPRMSDKLPICLFGIGHYPCQ